MQLTVLNEDPELNVTIGEEILLDGVDPALIPDYSGYGIVTVRTEHNPSTMWINSGPSALWYSGENPYGSVTLAHANVAEDTRPTTSNACLMFFSRKRVGFYSYGDRNWYGNVELDITTTPGDRWDMRVMPAGTEYQYKFNERRILIKGKI
jgi:hypothetical protein